MMIRPSSCWQIFGIAGQRKKGGGFFEVRSTSKLSFSLGVSAANTALMYTTMTVLPHYILPFAMLALNSMDKSIGIVLFQGY
jgi:hypothetical protein